MLTLKIPGREFFDESKGENGEFIKTDPVTIHLEHSLVSLSKWESKWEKSFLGTTNKTEEQTKSYIRDMTLEDDVDPLVYEALTEEHYTAISDYISAAMTATTVPEAESSKKGETITNELVYYWMVSMNIPFECQHWHLNRLLMLIRVCSVKNTPPGKAGKLSKAEMAAKRRQLNEQRRAQLGSRG